MTDFQPPPERKFASEQEMREFYESGQICRVAWTDHAKLRVVQMLDQGMQIDDLVSAYLQPSRVTHSEKYNAVLCKSPGVTLSLALGYQMCPVVMTVLWTTQDAWRKSYSAPVEGRERRFDLSHLPALFGAA